MPEAGSNALRVFLQFALGHLQFSSVLWSVFFCVCVCVGSLFQFIYHFIVTCSVFSGVWIRRTAGEEDQEDVSELRKFESTLSLVLHHSFRVY